MLQTSKEARFIKDRQALVQKVKCSAFSFRNIRIQK